MANIGLVTGVAVANTGITFMARVVGTGGIIITQPSIASITYGVTDISAASPTPVTGTLTVANVIFNTLQLDPRWTKDSAANPGPDGLAGYNFLAALPGTLFPVVQSSPGVPPYLPQPPIDTYQVDFTFTDTSSNTFKIPYRFTPIQTYS